MITLELAKRLKAAGYPQDDPLIGIIPKRMWRYNQPNSDELLAEIQRRWPEKSLTVQCDTAHDEYSWFAKYGCVFVWESTLLEALAELYIKTLMGGSDG